MQHIRKKADSVPYPYDYIENPAASGYRGIHDIYEYRARTGRSEDWNGLLVEIQYRTIYQHAWATAVEVAGSLTGNHSKFDRGNEDHKEFFRLTSEIIARAHEGLTSCKGPLSNEELLTEYQNLEDRIKLHHRLSILKVVNTTYGKRNMAKVYKNMILKFTGDDVVLYAYETRPEATQHYFQLEKLHPESDIVLVKAETLDSVKNAFRNYFSDVTDFVRLIETGIKKLKSRPKKTFISL